MSIFSDNFRSFVTGTLGSAKSITYSSCTQPLLQAINRYRGYLGTTDGPETSFFSAISMDSSLIDDRFIDQSVFEYDDDHPVFTEIDPLLADSMIQGISDACHNGQEGATSFEGVTITDGSGHGYNIVDYRSRGVVFDGKLVIFGYNQYASKISEAFIYQDLTTGKYYMNNFARSSDFAKSQGARRVLPETLRDKVYSCFVIAKGIDAAGSMLDVLNKLSGSTASTVIDALHNCFDAFDISWPGSSTIDGLTDLLWYSLNEMYPINEGSGVISSVWSILADHCENSQINASLLALCNIIVGSEKPDTAMTTLSNELAGSKYKTVRQLMSGASSAYGSGGITGLSSYVLSYANAASSVQVKDGILQFTDNTKLVPKVFLAGLLRAIATVLTTVVTLVVSIFSRILGAMIGIIGSVFSFMTGSAKAGTKASLNYNDTMLAIAPYGAAKSTLSISKFKGSDLYDLIKQGQTLVYATIPGGVVLIGPGAYNEKGVITHLRFEFHPYIYNSDRAVGEIWDYLYLTEDMITGSFVSDTRRTLALRKTSASKRKRVLKGIGSLWDEYIHDFELENGDDGLIADDTTVARWIAQNLWIGAVYLELLYGNHAWLSRSGHHTVYFSSDGSTDSSGHQRFFINQLNNPEMGLWRWLFCNTIGWKEQSFINPDYPDRRYYLSRETYTPVYPMDWVDVSNYPVASFNGVSFNKTPIYTMLINETFYYDELSMFYPGMQYAIKIPEYDAKSFWAMAALTVAVTLVSAAIICVATYKVKRLVNEKRASNDARIQRAYNAYVDDPTKENYDSYRKAVKKNNLWANFIGGSKYDTVSYWNGATNASDGSTTSEIKSPFFNLGTNDGSSVTGTTNADVAEVNASDSDFSTLSIKRLIVGTV